MKQINYKQAREDLRKWLVKYTADCVVQSGCDAKGKHKDFGWPCGTCTINLLNELGLIHNGEYRAHNKPTDRINEVWRAILQIREAEIKEIKLTPKKPK